VDVADAELERRLRKYFGDESTIKTSMVDVPDGSELMRHRFAWPVLCSRNVYVLPGVPELFRKKFAAIRERFRVAPFFVRVIYTKEDEFDLAERLSKVASSYPEVAIGSYPDFGSPQFKVKVTLESKNSEALESAVSDLLAALDADRIVTPQ
jgi:molybdopterin-biosynthesis enzyme MoeA-like protein